MQEESAKAETNISRTPGQPFAARMFTIADLVKDLRHMGVPEGGTIMLHASMRAIGAVDGGAASVVRALEAVVTPSGTILMVLGARDDWAWINARPEEERFVLLGGAEPFDSVTLFHYAEYLADLPNKRRVRRHRRVAGPGEPQVRVVECLDDSEGITDYPGEDYFADILTDFMKDHRGNCGLVGNAQSELLRAAELVEFASNWMSHNLNRGTSIPRLGDPG
ncbi:MAG: AAC(3) family N-acetyltransferase [Acidobacteria bacterium]|nr:AAC(3) family N-acetyltransferase [Acidobacteriota bacterium]